MPREYFSSKFQLDNRRRYFLWSSVHGEGDVDCDEVWTQNGVAPTFATLAQLETFAREEVGVSFAEHGEPRVQDLCWVARWLQHGKSRRSRSVRPQTMLSAWNIFSDLARSLEVPFHGDSRGLTGLWDMLLFGDPHKIGRYPRWSGAELQTLHDVLKEGLKLWRAHVR